MHIKRAYKSGQLNHAVNPIDSSDLQSKSMKPKSRGQKATDEKRVTEEKLMKFIRQLWAEHKKVTRLIVFNQVMNINPKFLGVTRSPGFYSRLCDWFYLGFKCRHNLSRRKVASVGQKVPDDWQEKKANIVQHVAHNQMPQRRANGSMIP